MKMQRMNRRDLLKQMATVAGAAALAPMAGCVHFSGKRSATDQVTLGSTGIKMSRLGMGTGSRGGQVQEALGEEVFCQLIKTAFDKGVTYFDCAHNYRPYKWMGKALSPLPRKEVFLLSKVWATPENPMQAIEDQLRNYQTDYIDCILCHCATKSTWTSDREKVMEAMIKARDQGKVRSVGVSCHSMDALEVAARSEWVQVNLVRVNPQAKHTDRRNDADKKAPAAIEPVLNEIAVMKKNGHGVIGMKIIGNGDFTDAEDREKSVRFAMSRSEIDSVTIGFKNAAEIDEAILRMNNALAVA